MRDFKLVGKAHPTQAQADASLQGGLYLLARAAEGEPAARFVLDSTRREHGPRSRTPRFAEVADRALAGGAGGAAAAGGGDALAVALFAAGGSWPYAPRGVVVRAGAVRGVGRRAPAAGWRPGAAPAAVDGAERRAAA